MDKQQESIVPALSISTGFEQNTSDQERIQGQTAPFLFSFPGVCDKDELLGSTPVLVCGFSQDIVYCRLSCTVCGLIFNEQQCKSSLCDV